MRQKSSNPLLDDGGFFVASERHDPRRSILVNGAAYRRQMNRKPEPVVSLWHSAAMALSLAVFVVGGLMFAAGVL